MQLTVGCGFSHVRNTRVFVTPNAGPRRNTLKDANPRGGTQVVSATATAAKRRRTTSSASPPKKSTLTGPSLADEDDHVNLVYYGRPKTGKTSHSAAMARRGKIVHIDAESGLKKKRLIEMGIPVGNILPFRDITVGAIENLFWDIKGAIEDKTENAPIGVMWDSTSESHKKMLELTAQGTYERDVRRGKEDRVRFSTQLEDYGINTSEVRYLARLLRDLPCHTAFVCLERREQDESTGKVQVIPDLTPRLAGDLMGFVDIICHTVTVTVPGQDEPEYWGHFRPFGIFAGGDRWNALPSRLYSPSFDRVIDYVNGDLTVETDTLQQEAMERKAERRARKQSGSNDD